MFYKPTRFIAKQSLSLTFITMPSQALHWLTGLKLRLRHGNLKERLYLISSYLLYHVLEIFNSANIKYEKTANFKYKPQLLLCAFNERTILLLFLSLGVFLQTHLLRVKRKFVFTVLVYLKQIFVNTNFFILTI